MLTGGVEPAGHPAWRELLRLGEQLLARPTIAAQHQLVVETAARLVGAQADLWLAEVLRRLPGAEESLGLPAEPASVLMRRAVDSQRISPAEEAELRNTLAVAIPLLVQGTVLGVLEVKRESGPAFSAEEIQLLVGLAAQSAIALQAARQVAVERWRVEQLSLVREVSAQVANVLDLDELSRRVTSLIRDTFKYYYVALITLEPGQEMLHCRNSAGPACAWRNGEEYLPVLEIRLGEGIVGRVAQTGVEILANDVSREPRYRAVDALPETRSEVAFPLKIEDRVLGVLDVQSDEPDSFDETDLLVLRALADQIAIALEDARLYSDLQRRADQLSAVAEVSRAVASILDLDTLLDQVVDLIRERFGYPYVHLLTADPARGQMVYRAGTGPRGKALREEGLFCRLDDTETIASLAACRGEAVLSNDIGGDTHYRPSEFSEAAARSELAVPLSFGERVLGVLDVQSDRRQAFTDEDQALFETLADSVAIAIRNANLYRSERWRRQVAESMREVAGLLSAGVGLDQVLDSILTELDRTLPCDVAAIWLLREDDLCLSAAHGTTAQECIGDLSPDAAPWLWQALQADEPTIRVPDSPREALGIAFGMPSDYSAIVAPLRLGDRRLGLLTLAHSTPGRYGSESRAMTAAFASYAAVAIENTRLYEAAQELASVSTVMLRVAQATQSLTTLDQVLATVVDLVPKLVGIDRCAILLWDELEGVFVRAAAHGFSPGQQATFDRWRVAPGDEPAFDDLRVNKIPVFIYDAAIDPRLSGATVWALGFESLLLLPLLARGEVLGVMLVDYRGDWSQLGTVETLRDERLAILQGITHQAAAAVENTRLREAQQAEAYVSAALLQVAQAVASLNDLDEILSVIVRVTPILVGVQRSIIFLWEDERSALRAAQAYGIPRDPDGGVQGRARLLARRYAPGDFPVLDAVREQNDLVVHSLGGLDAASDEGGEERVTAEGLLPPEFVADFVGPSRETTLSLLAVPLSVKGAVLGVMLLLQEGEPTSRARERRLEIITGIAQQAALAVQSDRLQQEMAERERVERELQLAREIQQTLMPRQLPDLPGWELAVLCRPARQVGGDFYDFFDLPGGRLALVIADVADKGMPAALFMAVTRTLVRAAALEEVSPTRVLARVNDLLVPDAEHGMFVTTLYAVLSFETGDLTYGNGGHNPPLLLRAGTGELERFATGGIALGVLEGARQEEQTVSLEPGDTLVFYTDGVTEAFSPQDDLYGEERLRATIRAASGRSAQAMLDAIADSVAAFAGDTPPSDDLTLMVLSRLE